MQRQPLMLMQKTQGIENNPCNLRISKQWQPVYRSTRSEIRQFALGNDFVAAFAHVDLLSGRAGKADIQAEPGCQSIIWCPGSAWTPAFAALPHGQKHPALPRDY
jgi:hypothetical protein